MSLSEDVATDAKDVTLLEVLDRILDKGVILAGDLTISVADVDLIFVGLKLMLASVERADSMRRGEISRRVADDWDSDDEGLGSIGGYRRESPMVADRG